MSKQQPRIISIGEHVVVYGGPGQWEYVSRRGGKQGVSIVALTAQNRLLLVEQCRIPFGKMVIELPAGLVSDSPGDGTESIIAAGRRELLEETGYACGKMTVLCSGSVLPGFSDEMNALCLAECLMPADEDMGRIASASGVFMHTKKHGLQEEGERITVYEVPRLKVLPWLRRQSRKGKVIDLKVYAGLFWLDCQRGSRK